MNKLTTKNWMRVRLNKTTKCITFTNDTTYKTKADCEYDIKSVQYISINLKALNKFVTEGYTINEQTITQPIENTVEVTVLSDNVIDLTGVPEVEEAIRQNYIKQAEKKAVIMYKGASIPNEPSDAVKLFLSTPPTQPKHKPLSVDKYTLTDKQYESNVNEVKRQRADYAGEVIL